MRYQFQSEQGNLSFGPRYFTQAIKVLISINALLFLFRYLSIEQYDLAQIFGLSSTDTMLWQPVTYMFMHGDFLHVFINMFLLWMFGSEIESIWGRREFLKYFFVTGVGSGLVWLLFNLGEPGLLIGSSGAGYGILLAYGLMFPNRTVLIYFLLPMKVKYFVIIFGLVAFFSSIGDSGSNISHLTHLSGMLIGFIYLKSPVNMSKISLLFNSILAEIKYKREEKKQAKQYVVKRNIDRLLDKINDVGYDGLDEKEKKDLYNHSRNLGESQDRD